MRRSSPAREGREPRLADARPKCRDRRSGDHWHGVAASRDAVTLPGVEKEQASPGSAWAGCLARLVVATEISDQPPVASGEGLRRDSRSFHTTIRWSRSLNISAPDEEAGRSWRSRLQAKHGSRLVKVFPRRAHGSGRPERSVFEFEIIRTNVQAPRSDA